MGYDSNLVSIAIISFVIPLLLASMSKEGARGVVAAGEVRYSRALRWGSLFLGFAPSFGIAALAIAMKGSPGPGQLTPIVLLMVFFPALSSPLMLELIRVRHRYNRVGLDYRSPWSQQRSLEWSEVVSLRWRKYVKWLDLTTAGGVTVHLSPLLSGLGPFADTALEHIPRDVLAAASPDARATLKLMSRGAAGPLLTSHLSPERLLASLPRS